MAKVEVLSRGYRIDLSRVEEGYLYEEFCCHAKTKGKAKTKLLEQIKYEGLCAEGTDEELNYLNIPVVRDQSYDLIEYKDRVFDSRVQFETFLQRELRELDLRDIIEDPNITHCHILKRGQYYRDNSSGYTDHKLAAGVYTKKVAVGEAVSCEDLVISPIDTEEHNAYLDTMIEEIKNRKIWQK